GRTSSQDTLDVAFLKIKDTQGRKLKAAKIGDSSKVQIGDTAIAIGNALGQFQNTVTSGIISGYGRSLRASASDGSSSENLEDLFQTDAAINEGNSGGPLVNLNGEVVGLNTAVSGEGQGLGFAIPINDLKGLIGSVMQSGKLERAYLGVVYVSITDDIAKQYGLNQTSGAYVAPAAITGQQPVIAGGPADKAGIKAGDIITKVNDKAVDKSNSLTSLISQFKVGDKVSLTVIRDGKQQTVSATLAPAPTD
ncbi:MAG TPA: trypsin-like peptidase domain-containing protein, partial [Ktedonobacteraceae bacterium]|nr:trypsin-like peptidase domain-containing protein [Ktedonobacteraceae bacterium]